MRIITAAAAVGLLVAFSAPSFAATTPSEIVDLSAAKKKAARKALDCNKAPSSRACKTKQSTELQTLDMSAAKKKAARRAVDCRKAPSSRACKNKQST